MDNPHELKIFSQEYMRISPSVEILWTSWDLPVAPAALTVLN